MENLKLSRGVPFTVLDSDKFKMNSFSLNFFLPLDDGNISAASVLARVMRRGTKRYPTKLSLVRKLDSIYGAGVSAYSMKMASSVAFRMVINFLDERFLPEGDTTDVFGEALDIAREMLSDPLTEGNGLPVAYTESEKKNQVAVIRADINNKDAYAFTRGMKATLGSIPFACDGHGTVGEIEKLTPEGLLLKLRDIVASSPVEATFAGNYTEAYGKKIDDFVSAVIGDRDPAGIIPIADKVPPEFGEGVNYVTEDVDAGQGRMVLGYDMGDLKGKEAAASVFCELFGGSSVSALFTNVREKMHLCYYCSSTVSASLAVMFVRSGIAPENKERALDAIAAELEKMKDVGNITSEALDIAKKGLLSRLISVEDSAQSHIEWYLSSKYSFLETDIKKRMKEISAVTVEDVAEMAARVRLKTVYFLNGVVGNDGSENDGDDEEDGDD